MWLTYTIVLAAAYVLFMKKYFHLHEAYLAQVAQLKVKNVKVCSNNYKILPELSSSVLVSFWHLCSQCLEP